MQIRSLLYGNLFLSDEGPTIETLDYRANVIQTGPIRKIMNWHVTRLNQSEHVILPKVACTI